MPEQLLHIYGPFAIHSFGLCASIGFLLCSYLFEKTIKHNAIMPQQILSLFIFISTSAALLGSRLLFFIQNIHNRIELKNFFHFWDGGFSLLGGVIGALCAMIVFLRYHRIAILPVLDSAALYFPLFQSIARLGCFFAGCCYGCPTQIPWSITYTQINSFAPLHVALHPTQLYSALLLLCIFITLRFLYNAYSHTQGACSTAYLILISSERIFIDFFRGDREFFNSISDVFSLHQIIAFLLIVGATTSFMYLQQKKHSIWPIS